MNSSDLSTVDTEISRRANELIALKTHRNTLVPISRLPDEVLSHIFILLRNSLWKGRANSSWIVVTHVCRNWHRLAGADPLLWTHIRIDNKTDADCVSCMLQRSKQVPLSLKIFVPFSRLSPAFEHSLAFILNNLDRAKSLHFWVPTHSLPVYGVFQQLLERATQARLESLFLWGQYRRWVPHFRDVQLLFSPSMRRLCIRVGITNSTNICYALSAMPLLNDLELHVASVDDDLEEASQNGPPPEFQLCLLQRVFLHGPPTLCATVLEAVQFPSAASITVRCPPREFPAGVDTAPEFASLTKVLKSKLCDANTAEDVPPISSLYVRTSAMWDSVVVDGWSTYQSADVLKTRPGGTKFHTVLPTSVAVEFAKGVAEVARDIQSLYIQQPELKEQWGEITRSMSNLRDLVVVGETCVVVPYMLGTDRPQWYELSEDLRSTAVLPRLQRLVVEGLPCFDAMTDDSFPLSLFKKILSARKSLSMGPTTIEVISPCDRAEEGFAEARISSSSKCAITFSSVDDYEDEDIDDFEWDNVYGNESHSDDEEYDYHDEEYYEDEDDDSDGISDPRLSDDDFL